MNILGTVAQWDKSVYWNRKVQTLFGQRLGLGFETTYKVPDDLRVETELTLLSDSHHVNEAASSTVAHS